MNPFERLTHKDEKQRILGQATLFGGFTLQASSDYDMFWIAELHRKVNKLARASHSAGTILRVTYIYENAGQIIRPEQPEPAPSLFQSAEAGGPLQLTPEGIQFVLGTYSSVLRDPRPTVLDRMPDSDFEKLQEQIEAASLLA